MANAHLHARTPGIAAPGVKPRPRQRADPCADECAPVCPACGGLECLCRPRFFAGQLLTDEDLNRLERYIVDKNRLHNRYLVGWGVACGLEVVCDTCDSDHVIVRTGYALSPCGDDIIVCRDHSVNICELIAQCRTQRDPVCDPPQPPPPRDCRGGNEKWVLAICYDERPSRGVTALIGASDDACCASCACGGSGSCGCKSGGDCGCGGCTGACACNGQPGTKKTRNATTRPRRGYAPQCEPTQICEGYRFIAYRAPKRERGLFDGMTIDEIRRKYGQTVGNEMIFAWLYANRARFGPLLERVLCCVLRALELRGAARDGKQITTVAGVAVYAEYAEALREFAADFSLHHCSFLSRVGREIDSVRGWTDATGGLQQLNPQQLAELTQGLDRLDAIWLDIVTECICSALLPACPGPEPKNCVPLAVITVGGNPCRVIDICNWEARKLLITWRTILYWLSWLPWHRLREWIAALCCGDKRGRAAYQWLVLILGIAMTSMKSQQGNAIGGAAMAGAAVGGVPAQDLFAAAMAAPSLFPHLVGEFENLRAGKDAQAPMWAEFVARVSDPASFAGPAGGEGAFAALKAQLDAMEKELASQRAVIDEMRRG